MEPNIVVLTDFSPAAAQARTYAAALAAPLGAVVHLVHIYSPVPLNVEYDMVTPLPMEARYMQQISHSLEELAAALPVPATAELLEADWYGAVQQTLRNYQPLLLVAGLSKTNGWLDEWLSNRALPLAHQPGYPLLLVPQELSAVPVCPPRRLVLAVQDEGFSLTAEARALAPLLDALHIEVVVVTVLPYEQRAAGEQGFHSAQHCRLAASVSRHDQHKVVHELPARGIMQAVDELAADGLVLLDLGHGWAHTLFEGSVISQVVRQTRVPVLLLPARPTPPHE
ncbi:hypothetical protein Hsw_2232 [Hymenobacter swuensis DY53]|uniref:UspA domain-containing protein n=2 Tax=Hymenobacter TaxID=89966 RepID=W8F1C9_9BACT|nr:hypothetical protein Hsw_2232 [Hymenobacter swuensis DY53]